MPAVEASPADILLEPKEGPIGLLALDSSKPGRPPGCRLTAHAAPDWSRAHLEEPRAMVEAALTRALGDRLGLATRPTSVRAHRWRYAQVEAALGKPCLYDPGLKLGAAGDWCLGPGIEAAHDSGLAPAGAILAGPGLSA